MPEPAQTAVSAPRFALGDGQAAYAAAVERARTEDWATRLFARDATLWTDDPRVAETILDRLGWLDAPAHFTEEIAGLEGFGDAVDDEGFTTAVVAGMGGSSLAPDVLRRTFGTVEGYLELRILDSTDPAYVAATLDDLDPLRTLVLVASKSGTTTEPNAFMAYAWARAEAALKAVPHHVYEHPGAYFALITDPGKSVDAIKHHDDVREVFLNPPDIGGRYSALTYVGLVPASLIGIDLDALLASASTMLAACRQPDIESNPGVSLGLAIGTLATAGRDKLTILADDDIASFGAWLEQLIAESTGKHQVGIVPVDLEPLGAVESYGRDRAFVRIALSGSDDGGRDALASGTRGRRSPGHPHRAERPDRHRCRVRPVGGRDRDRRCHPQDRSVRPAKRRGGEGADAAGARERRARQGPGDPTSPSRSRPATASPSTPMRRSGSPRAVATSSGS